MASLDNLAGIIPPLATPLRDDRKMDVPAMRRLVSHVIGGGVHGVFVMGSTGEFPAFTREERQTAIETVVDEVSGRVPVLAGVSDAGTELAVRNARDAEAAGADAVVVSLPYYFPIQSDSAVLEHFSWVADSTKLPLLVYNIPQIVKGVVRAEMVHALVERGIAFAVKDSSEDFTYFQELLFGRDTLPSLRVFLGGESMMGAGILMGGHGSVPGIANLAPEICVQVYEAASIGRIEDTRRLQRRLNSLCRLLYAGESVIASLKAALSLIGICGPATTVPLPPASEAARSEIKKIIEDFGLNISTPEAV